MTGFLPRPPETYAMQCICSLLLVLCLSIPAFSATGEPPAAAPATVAITKTVAADERSLLARESKQYLAQLTEERNSLRTANETLGTRQGLLIGYGVLMTLLAGWLMKRALAAAPAVKSKETDTDIFPADGTTTTLRKNATITIRNGATQQAEVTEKVQTRHAYARSDTGSHHRRAAVANGDTGATVRNPTTPRADAAITPKATTVPPATPPPAELAPTTQVRARSTATTQRPTVRVEHASDRLAPVEVAVKPGTAPIHRSSGRISGT